MGEGGGNNTETVGLTTPRYLQRPRPNQRTLSADSAHSRVHLRPRAPPPRWALEAGPERTVG